MRRERVVEEMAAYGGASCGGPVVLRRDCNEDPCPEDCNFEAWGEWSRCSTSCGVGVQERVRGQVIEKHGGRPCDGDQFKIKSACNVQKCPVDALWLDWNDWSWCTVTCGNGKRHRVRTFTEGAYGGKKAVGPEEEAEACTESHCIVDCKWASWADWTTCVGGCSEPGTRYRERGFEQQASGHGLPCEGDGVQQEFCLLAACKTDCEYGDWSAWESGDCDERKRTCGVGAEVRYRPQLPKAANGGGHCSGRSTQKKPCDFGACPVNCQYNAWEDWSECSRPCHGVERCTRSTKSPEHGGKACDVDLTIRTRLCNEAAKACEDKPKPEVNKAAAEQAARAKRENALVEQAVEESAAQPASAVLPAQPMNLSEAAASSGEGSAGAKPESRRMTVDDDDHRAKHDKALHKQRQPDQSKGVVGKVEHAESASTAEFNAQPAQLEEGRFDGAPAKAIFQEIQRGGTRRARAVGAIVTLVLCVGAVVG